MYKLIIHYDGRSQHSDVREFEDYLQLLASITSELHEDNTYYQSVRHKITYEIKYEERR